jgi:hypothetical protein
MRAKRQAKREKDRARATAYRKANTEKRNAYARARRAALSGAQRLAVSQRQKKWRTENREPRTENREPREVSQVSPPQQHQAVDKNPGPISSPDHCAGAGVAVVVVHDRSKTSFATTTPAIPPMQKQKRPNNSMGIRNTTLSSKAWPSSVVAHYLRARGIKLAFA